MPQYRTTRTSLISLIILLSACGQKNATDNVLPDKQAIVLADSIDSKPAQNIIEHIHEPYYVGDINNDKSVDTAYVIYDRSVRADGTIEKECANTNCEVKIKFTGNIPDLIIDHSLSVYLEKADDMNHDQANEIILFSEWFEGYWYNIFVWTFKSGKWEEVARTKAFLSEEKDYENRLIKIDSQFYLVGDGWDDSKGGVTERSIKVKIAK
ncbi:MAG TPA: hypothetical protein VIN08_24930 [Ohtaekwangia sp.]|uniref:hypothetical protein n=1 Tax=Ohtaekwangia sp. TaxID=2066019 RepID=UPI002F9216FD